VQVPLPGEGAPAPAAATAAAPKPQAAAKTAPPAAGGDQQPPKKEKKEKKKEAKGETKAKGGAEADGDLPPLSRVDFRVGLITEAKMHPDADSLYLETSKLGSGGGEKRRNG
jgi:aminoacyl tRNA synthase complex-interacting multifunctional protein 1